MVEKAVIKELLDNTFTVRPIKVHPIAGHEGLALISALGGDGWSTPRPDRFTPGKDPVPIV